ncbi:hypothetical protein D9M72_582060 [compost metagenome]
MVEHFPVAQVAGDADHAFAGGEGVLQNVEAFDLAHQVDGALGRPDPGAGAFGQGLADVFKALSD